MNFEVNRATLVILLSNYILSTVLISRYNYRWGGIGFDPPHMGIWTNDALIHLHLEVFFLKHQFHLLLVVPFSSHVVLLMFYVDNLHEIVEHIGVNIVKINLENYLLLSVKHPHNTCSHLPDFFVDPHKIGVSQIRSFTVDNVHITDVP